jgi:SAM-dependent MidA family methyltransferase
VNDVPGSDFVTAPELSPLFGWALAQQVVQALQVTATDQIWEFGAGSGASGAVRFCKLLKARGVALDSRYTIVDVSGSLRARQQAVLHEFGDLVCWVDSLPQQMQGVILGNEVLDAMPVKLLARVSGVWHERGVAIEHDSVEGAERLVWQDRFTTLRPPLEISKARTTTSPRFTRKAMRLCGRLGDRLVRGAAFLIDYGFPEAEYYHPQRHMGTLMCHKSHLADGDPLVDVGQKDITAHVNFHWRGAWPANDAGSRGAWATAIRRAS